MRVYVEKVAAGPGVPAVPAPSDRSQDLADGLAVQLMSLGAARPDPKDSAAVAAADLLDEEGVADWREVVRAISDDETPKPKKTRKK